MKYSALICDFDNTLYDWVGYFVPSLYRMIDVAAEILGCDKNELIRQFRTVHQSHGDSEHPFSLLETTIVRSAYPKADLKQLRAKLDAAFHAFNRSRKAHLETYDGVIGTLSSLTDLGVRIVGHSEARPLALYDRLRRLNLTAYFPRVYCRERAEAHSGTDFGNNGNAAELVELSHDQQKPSAAVLLEICAREDLDVDDVLYVGDSLYKDVSMANAAGMRVAWAKYGAHVDAKQYQKLVAVSHWTDADVARARAFSAGNKPAVPDFVLERSFSELLGVFGADAKLTACA